MTGTATKLRGVPRRRAAALASAALTLTLVAAATAATASPAGAATRQASQKAESHAAHTAYQPGTPAPPPQIPPPLDASGPAEVQALAQQYETDVNNDKQKADQLQNEKGTLEQRAGDIENRENSLASQATDLKTQADALEKQAQDLDAEITAHNNAPHVFELPDQEAQYAAYNAEKERLDGQKAALQSRLDGLNGQITKLQGDQNKAAADQTQLETDVQTHNDAVSALEQDVSRLADERQQVLTRISDLLQNLAAAQESCTCSAATGADQNRPAVAAAPPPQARALPSSGGDQPAPARTAYTPVGTGTSTGTPPASSSGAPSGAPTAAAPAPVVNPTPTRVTLPPSTVSALPPSKTANLNPSQTYSGLIPEPDGDFAAAEVQPPPGTALPPAQKAFDDVINNGGKATAQVGGRPATIDRVVPVTAAPSAQGGDVPRMTSPKPQRPLPKWLPNPKQPATQTEPPITPTALRYTLEQRGLGDLADQYDFEYEPVMIDVNGNPVYGSAPVDAAGNPLRGPTGKPVFRFTNLGLQNIDQGVRAFTGNLVESDLRLRGEPKFQGYHYMTGPEQQGPGVRYQQLVTGQKLEEYWNLDGNLIKVDGGPGTSGYIYEAKWAGNEKQWANSYYNPAKRNPRVEATVVDQAARLLALNRALGGPGVRYAISNPEAADYFRALLQSWFPNEVRSGELQVEYIPATGMK